MRFSPYIRADSRPVTRRRLAAARRTIQRERAKWGMFADQMTFETPEERIARIDAGVLAGVQLMRDNHAAMWRRGRRALFSLPPQRRRELLREWNGNHWLPGSPEYFLDFLHRKGVEV